MQAVYKHFMSGSSSPLVEIPAKVKEKESYFDQPEFLSRNFKFPDLTVTLEYPSFSFAPGD